MSATSTPLLFALTALTWGASALAARAESSIAEAPIPGTLATAAESLRVPSGPIAAVAAPPKQNVAQRRPRQRPVSRLAGYPNYIGAGINIGLDGDTALSDTNFALNSRIKFSPEVSIRPTAVIGDRATFFLPVTYDISIPAETEDFLAPTPTNVFLGLGPIFTLDDDEDNNIGAVLSAGVDIPIHEEFMANAGIHLGIFEEDTELGIVVGLAYTFERL